MVTTDNDFDMWLLLLLEIVVKWTGLCDWYWHWSMGEWFFHGLVYVLWQ